MGQAWRDFSDRGVRYEHVYRELTTEEKLDNALDLVKQRERDVQHWKEKAKSIYIKTRSTHQIKKNKEQLLEVLNQFRNNVPKFNGENEEIVIEKINAWINEINNI